MIVRSVHTVRDVHTVSSSKNAIVFLCTSSRKEVLRASPKRRRQYYCGHMITSYLWLRTDGFEPRLIPELLHVVTQGISSSQCRATSDNNMLLRGLISIPCTNSHTNTHRRIDSHTDHTETIIHKNTIRPITQKKMLTRKIEDVDDEEEWGKKKN